MQTTCPVCNERDKINMQDARLNIHSCNSCGHAFALVPQEKQEKYHEDYFSEKHKNWFANPSLGLFEATHSIIKRMLGNDKIELFDAGCGKGDFLKFIAAKDPTAELSGMDLAYNQHPRIHFVQGDLLKDNFEKQFKVICSLATIEHIKNPRLFIQKLKNALKPKGILIIMTMNNNCLLRKIAKILSKVEMHAAYSRLYSSHNLQYFTATSLRRLMEINDLEVLMQKNHNYSLKSVDVPRSRFVVEQIYKFSVAIIFLLSTIFGNQMLQTIVCRKK